MALTPTVDDRSPLWRLFISLVIAIVLAERCSKSFLEYALGIWALVMAEVQVISHRQHLFAEKQCHLTPFKTYHKTATKRVVLCILGIAFYAQYRLHPSLDIDWHPGWYTMDIRLQRIYARTQGQKHQVYGQGVVVNGPSLPAEFNNQRIYFMLYEKTPQLHYRSQIVRIRGHIRHIYGNYDPHSFESYLQRVRIPLQIDRGDIQSILHEGSFFFRCCYHIQCRIRSFLSHVHEDSSILRCMLLNDRGDVQRSRKQLFARTGVAHLLAISGLHIGMIGLALEFFLRLWRLSKRQRRIPCILILGLYTCTIGAPPSAIRAFLMLTYLWSACFFSRKATTLSAISFAGIFSLLANPYQLWDWGFQFSYIAVLCIILIGSPLASRMITIFRLSSSHEKPIRHHSLGIRCCRSAMAYSLQSFCISVPISILMIPLSIEYFGSFSLSGIVINLIAIPLAFGIIIGGFGTIIIGFLLGNPSSQWILKHWLQPYVHRFEGILYWCDIHLPYAWTGQNLSPGIGITVCIVVTMISLVWHRSYRKHFHSTHSIKTCRMPMKC